MSRGISALVTQVAAYLNKAKKPDLHQARKVMSAGASASAGKLARLARENPVSAILIASAMPGFDFDGLEQLAEEHAVPLAHKTVASIDNSSDLSLDHGDLVKIKDEMNDISRAIAYFGSLDQFMTIRRALATPDANITTYLKLKQLAIR